MPLFRKFWSPNGTSYCATSREPLALRCKHTLVSLTVERAPGIPKSFLKGFKRLPGGRPPPLGCLAFPLATPWTPWESLKLAEEKPCL